MSQSRRKTQTAKNSKRTIIRDFAIKQFKGCFVMKKKGWKSIDKVHCCENAVTSIGNRNVGLNS